MKISKRLCAMLTIMILIAWGVAFNSSDVNAAAKLTMPTKVNVSVGKAKALKITAKGYTVKKVSCVSEGMNVKIKTSKKAVTITAKSGTGGMSDYLVTTVKAKKGKKTKTFKFYTTVIIKGSSAASATKNISSITELKAIDPNSTTKYVLTDDIDMTGWVTIDKMYCSIDGAGHTLKNMSVPLVGKLYGGTIKNLTFDLAIDSIYELWGDKYVAPIGYIGPGNNNEVATVSHCASCGYIKLNNTLGDDQSQDTTPMYVAGIVGTNPNNYGMVENCINNASITTSGYSKIAVGGIIANVAGKTGEIVIKECCNAGELNIDNDGDDAMGSGVGAIAGYATSSAVMKDCLNTGKATATKAKRSAGGFVGFGDQRLLNCVNLGKSSYGVYGGEVDKDIIDSWNYSAQMFTNVYYKGTIEYGFNWRNNPVEVPGVKSVADITDQSAYEGLDFTNVWVMGATGPELRNLP